MRTYTVTEFSKIIGISVSTLQRWDRQKRLVPGRTPTNRRIYTDEHLRQATGILNQSKKRKVVVYARVSSKAQRSDLSNQRKMLEEFCAASGLVVEEWIEEIGGGLNFNRPRFTYLIDAIIAGNVETLVIAHKDRLCRFGFELIEHLCKTHGCNLLVMNMESLSPEQEMVQDILAIVRCFSARLYGLRKYRKALKKALESDTRT
ncbi:IS607 family transposase [Dehalococcoidia bacterium]|nr:IS607 family transposase [Dehalococcoidia bacterium]